MHRSGKSNTKADLLSQCADYPKGENDNQDVLLKEEIFRNIEIRLDEMSYELLEVQDKASKIHKRFYDKQVLNGIKNKDPNFKWDKDIQMWTWKERKYIPINKELRERIIAWDHLDPMAGHPGVVKTLELITREYWWPRMKEDIKKYIKACHECR